MQVVYSRKGFIYINQYRLFLYTVPVRICAGRVFSLRFGFDNNEYINRYRLFLHAVPVRICAGRVFS